MQWPSPWGKGYPGWHLECSAMSMKYLGETFDIHGGGLENQFPHHECEIAQSECTSGHQFVKYWLHNNMVTVGGQKMGKSLGNFVTLKDAFKKFPPVVVRFFILQSHYRSTLDFSDEAIEGAAKGYERLINTVRNVRAQLPKSAPGSSASIDLAKYKAAFIEAMNDDFNTPQAIAVLFDMNRELNPLLTEGKAPKETLAAADLLYRELGGSVLGIIPEETAVSSGPSSEEGLMNLIVALRAEARTQKQFGISDRIRDGLATLGIVIEDKKEGTTWRKS
jgi:cysteinyl-tRNA synthetase